MRLESTPREETCQWPESDCPGWISQSRPLTPPLSPRPVDPVLHCLSVLLLPEVIMPPPAKRLCYMKCWSCMLKENFQSQSEKWGLWSAEVPECEEERIQLSYYNGFWPQYLNKRYSVPMLLIFHVGEKKKLRKTDVCRILCSY